METTHPESNAGMLALNMVYEAIVDEVSTPGDGLAGLFAKMTSIANEIRAAALVAHAGKKKGKEKRGHSTFPR